MKSFPMGAAILGTFLGLASAGCNHLPGKPGFRPETLRPDQTQDFAVLYKTNCSACHGEQGKNGPALPLNNPDYLAWAGHDAMVRIVSNGVPHRLMPAFGPAAGGMLTDRQVGDIVNGMISKWGKPGALNGANAPAYAATAAGDASLGKTAFQTYCARCHGADGKGMSGGGAKVSGSIVDPSYLDLISSQGLRDIIVAGMPDENMPDWRGDVPGKAMTDQEVTNVTAWLVAQRTAYPGTFVPPARKRQEMRPDTSNNMSGRR